MKASRVYAGAEHAESPAKVHVQSSPSWNLVRKRIGVRATVWERVQQCYGRLSWTTRQTISVGVSLAALLYVFISVPFRIGFLYNPFDTNRDDEWTWELDVFTPVDLVTDLIGVVEFVRFYSLWRSETSHQAEVERFEQDVKRVHEARSQSLKVLPRARSTMRPREGKAKWTLANIGRAKTSYENTKDDFDVQKESRAKRNWEMALEIVSLLPLEVLPFATQSFNALHLVRFNKLCRVYKLRHCFSRISKIYSDRAWIHQLSSTGVASLVRTIGFCAASCHWAACGYMLVAHSQCGVSLQACNPDIETSWVVRDQLFGATVSRKYSRALYWATRTMVLFGCGDTTPVSNSETLYAMGVQLLGGFFSSYILANFVFIFRFRNARHSAYSTHVDNAREYMRSQGIPRAIRHQVIAYFNYTWNMHHSLDSEEPLRAMPTHLQSKVVATLKASRIKQVCFLAKENPEFINLLALSLERRVYSPMDQIIEPKGNAQMFFVIRGNVVVSARNGSNPKNCQNGDLFAELCLLYPEQFEEQAVANTFCELYVLHKAKFDEAVRHFYRDEEPTVLANMAAILDKYLIQQRKTQQLLGHGDHERNSVRVANRRMSGYQSGSKIRVAWNLPDSSFRAVWDLLRLVGTIYVAFEVPYYAVFVVMAKYENIFSDESTGSARYVCTLICELFFAVDIVLRARYLAYVDPVVMLNVVDPTLIFMAYRENGFYIDLLAWLPVGLCLECIKSGANLSWMFRLLRLLRLRSAPSLLRDLCESYNITSQVRLFISLLLSVALILHVVGCIWFDMAWVGQEGIDATTLQQLTRSECLRRASGVEDCSWVKFDSFSQVGAAWNKTEDKLVYDSTFAYIRAVYWSVSSLTAVGYGDIAAFSTAESYFAAVWTFVGGIVNFGVVGAMSNVISNSMATRHDHLEFLNALSSTMGRIGISKRLSVDIRRFYNSQFNGRKLAYESQLLSNLPDQLCYQISSLLHSSAVKSVELFDSASVEFLHEVTGKFRHRSYEFGESICLRGDICREFLVFLQDSKVNMFYSSRKVPVRALHEGDCYGVNEFLLQRAHPATLTAASSVHASVMTRDQFDGIQRKFEDDLRDMTIEAHALWSAQQTVLRCTARNLERLKLKSHVMETPTLFYQRELTGGTSISVNIKKVSREAYDTRTMFMNAWHAGVTFWNAYNAFFVIFRIGFHSQLRFSSTVDVAVWTTDLVGDIYLALDIYLRLYYLNCPDAGFNNLFRRKLVDQVYRHSFRLKSDLVSLLPIYVPMSSGSLVVSLCRLPRLVRCPDLWGYMDEMILQIQQLFASRNVSDYLRPVKLTIVLLFAAHVIGSFFVLFSYHECDTVSRCWMNQHKLSDKYGHDVWILYGNAVYWAVTTLVQINSPDIVPRGLITTIWTSLTCLSCSFAMGYVVGEITDLIMGFSKQQKAFKNRISSFEIFAKTHRLPETLRKRARYFYQFQFDNTEGDELTPMTHQLSANLKLKLMMEVHGLLLAQLPISNFLSVMQISNLALHLRSELFIPGDNIIVEGTPGSRLYTLRKGVAAGYWTKSVASVALLLEGALFGEVAFFVPQQYRLVTVRATTACEVLYVARQDWNDLWIPTGDPSDSQVQKYSLHAILDWVNHRLDRYQSRSLAVARKIKIEVAGRHESSPKAERKISRSSMSRRKSSSQLFAFKQPTQRQSFAKRSFIAPEIHKVELKAKYVLAKADEYLKRFRPVLQTTRITRPSTITRALSSKKSILGNLSRAHTVVTDGRVWRSIRGDSPVSPLKASRPSVQNIRSHQFIIDLNPVNKTVRGSLKNEELRRLEDECWHRFKLIKSLQHRVDKLRDELISPTLGSGHTVSKSRGRMNPARHDARHLKRIHSVDTEMTRPLRSQEDNTIDVKRNLFTPNQASTMEKRPFTAVPSGQVSDRGLTKVEVSHPRLRRYHSLPEFSHQFFEHAAHDVMNGALARDVLSVGGDVNFEIIQRCQRPKYESYLRAYYAYHAWRKQRQSRRRQAYLALLRGASALKQEKVKPRRVSLESNLHVESLSRLASEDNKPTRGAVLTGSGSLGDVITDKMTRDIVTTVKRSGKLWDLVMLIFAVYYVVSTPFKVCFARDLRTLGDDSLRSWAAIDIVLDILCLMDVLYKARDTLGSQSAGLRSATSCLKLFRRLFTADPVLRADIIAILPLEALLAVPQVRVSLNDEAIRGWDARWVLRLNRMMFGSRIESLCDGLLEYATSDWNIKINGPVVTFYRAILSHLTVAHVLACIWFGASVFVLGRYGQSWLSTAGMLGYIPPNTSQEMVASGNFLADIPLGHQYLRSLYFSIQAVTTIYYGDITSTNPLEMAAELVVSLCGVYLFATFIGAQEELLNSRTKQEASFEQQLVELQLYLVQNDVPRNIKRQIKAYYAHMWYRSNGEDGYGVLGDVSVVLREEIVLATMRDFVVRVEIFRTMDESFLRSLLVCLQYVVCSEGEDVVVAGDIDRSMYFIDQGHILVKIGDAEIPRQRGEYFGQLALLYGISRLETCVAVTVAELYRLDHEPYERLLVDFPEYRVRNKLEWTMTASSSFDRIVLENTAHKHGPNAVVFGLDKLHPYVVTQEANWVESELPHSFVYMSAMEMLARMDDINPLDAKVLVLKSREGGYKHVKARHHSVVEETETQVDENSQSVEVVEQIHEVYDDIIHRFGSRPRAPSICNIQRRSSVRLSDLENEAHPPGGMEPYAED